MNITYRLADPKNPRDLIEIKNVTNEAFMADTFFKKKEYYERFDNDSVSSMINSENSVFILAEIDNMIVGSIFLETSHEILYKEQQISNLDKVVSIVTTGKFSAVSVLNSWGKKGIGKSLVSQAELYTMKMSKQFYDQKKKDNEEDCTNYSSSTFIEMGVINLRKDLFPWFLKDLIL